VVPLHGNELERLGTLGGIGRPIVCACAVSQKFTCAGSKLYGVVNGQSQDTLEPGLVKTKTGSVFSLGQQRPRLE
jgi:hypothetical protein